jgi:iron complex outermembrane receptor protein
MRTRTFLRTSASGLMLVAVALTASAAQAQDETAPTGVDEIIVTAQRREQSLQDVPIVVTSVSGQLLQDAGVRDIKDLTVLTPGLLVTSTTNESVTSARIRGVGTVGDNPGLESSVGVLIDGVYRPRNGVGFGDLGETERIEVLKGPQGTLFGKNTSSGVINIITRSPQFSFGATSEATVGNYGAVGFSTSVTGPFTDSLAGRLYVAARKRDGFQDVRTGRGPRTDDTDSDQNFYTGRGQLLWRASPDLNVRLIGDYSKRDETCCIGVQVQNGPTAAVTNGVGAAIGIGPAILAPPNPDDRLAFANRPTDQEIEDKGLSAEVNWVTPWLGRATLTSVTAVREWETVNGQDSDFTALDLLYRAPDADFFRTFNQFSQEFRLAGETEKVNWLVGAFYAKERLKSGEAFYFGGDLELYLDQLVRATAAPGSAARTLGLAALTGRALGTNVVPGLAQADRYSQESESWAVFGNVSYQVTDKLELTGGLRYTAEDKELASFYRNATGGAAGGASPNPCNPASLATNPALATAGVTAQTVYVGYFCAPFADPAYNSLNTRQSRTEEEFSGTAKLAYRFNEDVMTYLSYARGYKAGGFNLDRVRIGSAANPSGVGFPNVNTAFPAEFVDSWELGAKTTLLDRTLLLNATLFWQKYQDYQLNAFNGVAFTVVAVPEVISRGVDVDAIWRTPLEGLSIQGGVTYAESQYGDDRPDATFQQPAGGFRRLPGSRLSFAPLWSGSLSGTYEHELSDSLMLRANLSAKYTSAFNTGSDLLPAKEQAALTLVNGRIGIGSDDERWTVELWGQNLTDETYLQVAFDGTLQPQQVNGFLGVPRTYGATLRFKY